jgi:hypothetical protein
MLGAAKRAIPVRYFRTAHAYILISKPTVISTIFGVFQVIHFLLGLDGRLPCQRSAKNCEDLKSSQSGEMPLAEPRCNWLRRSSLKAFDVCPIRTRPQNFVIAILVVGAGAVTH